jgi:radical SAM protein with 4Fe4S-binding SPASM domain
MLSFSRADIEEYARPLCSQEIFERKMDNFRKIEDSYVSKDEYSRGLPIQIHLEPSGDCNLFCPICPRGRKKIRRQGLLSFEIFQEVFNAVQKTLFNIIISGFGEPLLNDQTARMIGLASKYEVSTIMNSNGTVIADYVDDILDSQLTVINIALDGATADSCHRYNPAHPFSYVVNGVERLRNKKETGNYTYPILLGQFIITDEPIEELERLKQWATDIGIERIKFKRRHKTMPSEIERNEVLPENRAERQSDQKLVSTQKLHWSPLQCSKPWDSFFLSCTGAIGLCSFDPYQVMKLGSFQDDFNGIWNGDTIRKIRRWHSLTYADIREPCSKCNRAPGYLKFVE